MATERVAAEAAAVQALPVTRADRPVDGDGARQEAGGATVLGLAHFTVLACDPRRMWWGAVRLDPRAHTRTTQIQGLPMANAMQPCVFGHPPPVWSLVGLRATTGKRARSANPPPPTPDQQTFGPTEGQNAQWREANRHRQRQTIRYRGLVPNPPPPNPSDDSPDLPPSAKTPIPLKCA